MRRALHIVAAFLLGALPAYAQSLPFPGPGAASGAATYVGVGDLTTYTWYVSTARAYSAAKRGTKAVQLCQPAASNCVDVNSDATTGLVPTTPTVNGAACDNASHICTIQCMYNQLGVAADDQCRAGNASQQPIWVTSAVGGRPCGQYTRATPSLLVNGGAGTSVTQPFLASAVAKRNTGQTGNQNTIVGSNAGTLAVVNAVGASNVNIFAGTALPVTLTDGNYGSIAAIFNGGSSYLNVNATTASGAGGANNPGATTAIGTDDTGVNPEDGVICEVGFASGASSTATADSVEANTKTFYGF